MPGSINVDSNSALYYKLDLTSAPLTRALSPTRSTTDESIHSVIKSGSPSRRSWFDDATANSLERRSRKKKSTISSRKSPGLYHTLPRGLKLGSSNLARPENGVCAPPSPTPTNLSSRSLGGYTSPLSTCDNINLALNNSLRFRGSIGSTDASSSGLSSATSSCQDEKVFPFENKKYSRRRIFSPTNITASRNENVKISRILNEELTIRVGKCETLQKTRIKTRDAERDGREIEVTRQLVGAIRELKDIADVARIIDDVDNEEWLLIFIGELEVHLNDLIKLDSGRTSLPSKTISSEERNLDDDDDEEHFLEEEMKQKETLLRVALDLIRYLKDRSTYALHRRSSSNRYSRSSSNASDNTDTGTLRRLKALASEKPQDFTSMNKWQRKLSCLAGTLDKYLQRLESKTSRVVISCEPDELEATSDSQGENPMTSSYLCNPINGVDEKNTGNTDLNEQTSHNTSSRNSLSKRSQPLDSFKGFSDHRSTRNGHKHYGRYETSMDLSQNIDNDLTLTNGRYQTDVDINSDKRHVKHSENDLGKVSRYTERFERTSPQKFDNDSKSSSSCQVDGNVIAQTTRGRDKSLNVTSGRKNGDSDPYTRWCERREKNNQEDAANSDQSVVHNQSSRPSQSSKRVPEAKASTSKIASASAHSVSGYSTLPTRNRLRGGSLDRKTWRKERESRRTWRVSVSSEDSIDVLDHVSHRATVANHLSVYNHRHSRSDASKSESNDESAVSLDGEVRKKQVSEFRMSIGSRRKVEKKSKDEPKMICETIESPVVATDLQSGYCQEVIESDIESSITCRLSEWNRTRKGRFSSDTSVSSMSDRLYSVASKPSTSTSSTQCNIISNERVKKADGELNKLKKSSDLLRRGITEAREERDEKDRRIAVLESRVQRLKKSMEQGNTEKGSVEEELERLQRILNQERRDAGHEISDLHKRLATLDAKIEIENRRVVSLERSIEQLKDENKAIQKKCADLEKSNRELEEKLHDATMALMREKRHSRRLQAENTRLEFEILKVNDERKKEKNLAKEREDRNRQDTVIHVVEDAVAAVLREEDSQRQTLNREEQRVRDNKKLLDLTEQNDKLAAENNELRSKLNNEQSVSEAATDCFRQQIEYLSNEVSLQQESARAQKDQYESEIDRLLSSRSTNLSTSSVDDVEVNSDVEVTSLRSQIVYQETLTRTLYVENERLRRERNDLKIQLENQVSQPCSPTTRDFGCQYDDMSYTRMRAYDFYAHEAHSNALRLTQRGRQLQEEGLHQSMRTQRLEVDVLRKTSTGVNRKYNV